jgi:membrane-associated phospholipid phosphatase
VVRWWPLVAAVGVAVLGWLVGRGSTPLDDWLLAIDGPDWLLVLVDERVLIGALAAAVVVALWRRQWRLTLVAALCPPVAVGTTQILKRVFDRELTGELAYPSGHVTALVSVVGVVVLVAGARRWMVAAGAVVMVVGMFAVGLTFHYFTDTVGALLVGTGVVALGARLAGRDVRVLDRCQPRVRSASQRGLTLPHDRDARS